MTNRRPTIEHDLFAANNLVVLEAFPNGFRELPAVLLRLEPRVAAIKAIENPIPRHASTCRDEKNEGETEPPSAAPVWRFGRTRHGWIT